MIGIGILLTVYYYTIFDLNFRLSFSERNDENKNNVEPLILLHFSDCLHDFVRGFLFSTVKVVCVEKERL